MLLHKRYSLRNIAGALRRSVSTISDEIATNSVKGAYDPQKAHLKASARRRNASWRGKKIVRHDALRAFVEANLSDGQSPAAIAGRIRFHEKKLPNVSKDTIYHFLRSPYGKTIALLRQQKKRRKRRTRRKKEKLADRRFIEKRPKIANTRGRGGDAEADFILSGRDGRGVLLGVVDRKLRVAFLELISTVTVDNVHRAFQRIQRRYPEMKTLTLDNDILFQMHRTLEQLLGVRIYFCHPYHSWEKGGIENVNKHIRKFIPKGSDLSRYTTDEIRAVEEFLNSRYMECLSYATPAEKLKQHRERNKRNKKTAGNAA